MIGIVSLRFRPFGDCSLLWCTFKHFLHFLFYFRWIVFHLQRMLLPVFVLVELLFGLRVVVVLSEIDLWVGIDDEVGVGGEVEVVSVEILFHFAFCLSRAEALHVVVGVGLDALATGDAAEHLSDRGSVENAHDSEHHDEHCRGQ